MTFNVCDFTVIEFCEISTRRPLAIMSWKSTLSLDDAPNISARDCSVGDNVFICKKETPPSGSPTWKRCGQQSEAPPSGTLS